MGAKKLEELIAWQLAHEFKLEVYRVAKTSDAAMREIEYRSQLFGAVQMHETRVVAGVSTMRGKGRLALAPHGVLVFAPGGNHLMLMKPVHAMPLGGHVRIDFVLGDGRVVVGDFVVRADAP